MGGNLRTAAWFADLFQQGSGLVSASMRASGNATRVATLANIIAESIEKDVAQALAVVSEASAAKTVDDEQQGSFFAAIGALASMTSLSIPLEKVAMVGTEALSVVES